MIVEQLSDFLKKELNKIIETTGYQDNILSVLKILPAIIENEKKQLKNGTLQTMFTQKQFEEYLEIFNEICEDTFILNTILKKNLVAIAENAGENVKKQNDTRLIAGLFIVDKVTSSMKKINQLTNIAKMSNPVDLVKGALFELKLHKFSPYIDYFDYQSVEEVLTNNSIYIVCHVQDSKYRSETGATLKVGVLKSFDTQNEVIEFCKKHNISSKFISTKVLCR